MVGLVLWERQAGAPARTHLGRALELTGSVGPAYAAAVAARKVALNWRLVRYSLYSRLAAVALVAVLAAFWRPSGALRAALERLPRLRLALEAAAVGAGAALVANDSGITAAATALLGPAALVLEMALGENGAEASHQPRPG